MLGSNDTKPENWKGIDEFEKDYIALLKSYKEVNNNAVIYICTPAVALDDDLSDTVTNFDIQPCYVDEIAEFVRNFASVNGYKLIDINSLTSENENYFSSDNVHPNKAGAKAIAEEVYNCIKK
jgi:sialate O-acetylesterase